MKEGRVGDLRRGGLESAWFLGQLTSMESGEKRLSVALLVFSANFQNDGHKSLHLQISTQKLSECPLSLCVAVTQRIYHSHTV